MRSSRWRKKDLEALKEEMKSTTDGEADAQMCSEASTGVGLGGSGTFAGPPALASWFSEIFITQEDGILKDGSRTARKCGTPGAHGSRPPRSRSSSETYKRWCRINFTSTLTGIKPGQSKGPGRPRRLSICGSENETNLATIIGLLEIVEEELKTGTLTSGNGQEVSARLANEPERMLCFTKVSKKWEEMSLR